MLTERFWSKVDIRGPDDCWLWTANKNNHGYGLFRPGGTAPKRLAHRLAYEDAFGEIPKGEGYHGICILHKCDNPPCVNPRHLRAGTMLENTRDMIEKGRKVVGFNPNNRPPIKRGSAHGQAKLTEEDVIKMREKMASGQSARSVAAEFGVSKKTALGIKHRTGWKHI